MRSNKQTSFYISTALLFVLLVFQNCTRLVNFGSIYDPSLETSLDPLKSENNGEIYLGKPEPVEFVKTFLNYSCDQARSDIQSTALISTDHLVVTNDNCFDLSLQIAFTDPRFSYSEFNTDYIFINNVPYEKTSSFKNDLEMSTEAFCKSSDLNNEMHVVAKTDRSNQPKIKIYLGQKKPGNIWLSRIVPLFSVKRSDAENINYKTDQFELSIANNSKQQLSTYSAELNTVIDGQKINSKLTCYKMNSKPTFPSDRSLVATWQMNNSLTELIDAVSTFWYIATGGSAQYTAGIYSDAISLVGSNTYLFTSAPAGTLATDNLVSMTVSAWVNPTSIGGNLVSKSTDPSVAQFEGWRLYQRPRGEIVFEAAFDLGIYAVSTQLNNLISIGAWNHIVVTFDSSDLFATQIFVNGVSQSLSVPRIANGPKTNDIPYPVRIGGQSLLGGLGYNGLVDQVTIWNRTISPAGIADLYEFGVPFR